MTDPGLKYADDVVRLCMDAEATTVRIVQVPDEFPDKWDIADAIPEGWTLGRLRGLLDAAEPWADVKLLSVLSVRDWGVCENLSPLLPTVPPLPPKLVPEPLLPWLEDMAERIGVPLEFVAAPAVVALSSVIGRTVGIYPKQIDD